MQACTPQELLARIMAMHGIPAMRPALTCSGSCELLSFKNCPTSDKVACAPDAIGATVLPRQGLVPRARRAATTVVTKLRSAWHAVSRLGSCMQGGGVL